MSELDIPFVPLDAGITFELINAELNCLPQHNLEYLLWSNNGYKPKVSFTIAHNGGSIFLQFKVEEDNVRAVYNQINDPVYKDSCVEFFISLGDDDNYYNLEFNRLGTCTIGYGKDKFNREILPDHVIGNILSKTKIERVDMAFVYAWELTLLIFATVFIHHTDIDLAGKTCRVNFYKCGDDLPQPHFVAWNNIEAAQPNFHLPQFFGNGLFLKQ